MDRSQRLAAEGAVLAALARLDDPQLAVLLDEATRMGEGSGIKQALHALTPALNRMVREACEFFGATAGASASDVLSFVHPECRVPVARFPRAHWIRLDRLVGGRMTEVVRITRATEMRWVLNQSVRAVITDGAVDTAQGPVRGELTFRTGERFGLRPRTTLVLPEPYLSLLVRDALAAGVLLAPPRVFVMPGHKSRPASPTNEQREGAVVRAARLRREASLIFWPVSPRI